MAIISAPSTPGYSQVTQTQALTLLSDRLNDTGNVYWSLAELRLYLAEALRTWQAYTGWYRARATLTITASENWYEIETYTVTDASVASVMLYHLLEGQLASGLWAGTTQFDLAGLQGALQTRLNRFLSDTGVVSTRRQELSGTPVNGRINLQPDILDIKRLVWGSTLLWRESESSLNFFLPAWQSSSSAPVAYSVTAAQPTTVQVAPPPTTGATLDMVVVTSGPTLNLTSIILGVPDDFAWGVKWGALAELLSRDGPAKDPTRAAYCESRYQEAVELARLFPSVVQVVVNGATIPINSVFDLDTYRPSWTAETAGVPDTAGLVGRNLLALVPAPTAGVTVNLDMIVNMPLPSSDSSFLQVPLDLVPVILDYAQHLASFKMGGAEFMATDIQRQNIVKEAANYNSRLRATNFYNDLIPEASSEQTSQVARLAPRLQLNG